jgi:type I restriction enzyme R subunit
LIGVADDGSVFGLDSDYATLRKPGKDDRDLFGLHLNRALINSVGMAAAANVGQEILEAEVVEVDKYGQHVKKKVFCGRFGNGTRQVTDPTERERYQVQVWGP